MRKKRIKRFLICFLFGMMFSTFIILEASVLSLLFYFISAIMIGLILEKINFFNY